MNLLYILFIVHVKKARTKTKIRFLNLLTKRGAVAEKIIVLMTSEKII